MDRVKCAQCGKETDYDDFPIVEKLNLVAGESMCSICTEEDREKYYLTLADETTPENMNNRVDSLLNEKARNLEEPKKWEQTWDSIEVGVGYIILFITLIGFLLGEISLKEFIRKWWFVGLVLLVWIINLFEKNKGKENEETENQDSE